ncbi:MAG: glycogen/starch/alpha-glucan phosphorylase [Candidatus Theseobacter exili]|nr:glycogen/starch/alpha-glucan phosphorylase [Candidatus Theseobacter exili]
MGTSKKANKENGRPDLWKDYRKGLDVESLKLSFSNQLKYSLAKDKYSATDHDRFYALALAVRDRLIERWITTQQTYHNVGAKRIYYLSLEFLLGRAMVNNVINMEIEDVCKQSMNELGLDWNMLGEMEEDAGLGNGGLGRLAACFIDSMATMKLPGMGYSLRYEYGIFNQAIRNCEQVELPDNWLRLGNPWEISRPEFMFKVHFYGRVETYNDNGEPHYRWSNTRPVIGIPYDIPIVGYGSNNVNNLRLWSSKATEDFDFEDFNQGDYQKAVEHKILAENLTKVLYPNDNVMQGKELRFKQEYFFVSCTIQDIIRRYLNDHKDFMAFPDRVAIQLNDTHPALAIPELMRILIDIYRVTWNTAWEITVATFAYTNHTLLPEALEEWPVEFFKKILPRHLQIIYEINRRFLRKVANRYPNNLSRLGRMSIIKEGAQKNVRMAYLSIVGSHSVNGVAALHTKLLKEKVVPDFSEFFPKRFNNKTNGITQRRWLLKSNPRLASLITERIGKGWITKLSELKKLEEHIDDKGFLERFDSIKRANKKDLANYIKTIKGIQVNPDSIFDVHIKRIHEYKRQLLNILHIILLYDKLKNNPSMNIYPRTFIFGGKAAPGYFQAKLIIKLINEVAEVVNNDTDINDSIKIVFLPNYRVSLAEKIFPAADVSEQISTAGTEASGTGNMKFALNGAVTVGTLDGANIEILEEVGKENIFIFGLTTEKVSQMKARGNYDPVSIRNKNKDIDKLFALIESNFFAPDEPGIFQPILDSLFRWGDQYFHLADLPMYIKCQKNVEEIYKNKNKWLRMTALNVCRSGKFSSDRTIAEYNKDIWHVKPVDIVLNKEPNKI